MSDSDGPNIKEVILSEIQETGRYHDQKTHSAWLVCSLYLTFSAAFIAFWVKVCPGGLAPLLATIGSAVIFVSAMSFASLQFKSRWDSVDRSDMFRWLIREKWHLLKDGHDFQNFQDEHEAILKDQVSLGVRKRRWTLDILWLPFAMPFVLIGDFVHKLWAAGRPDRFSNRLNRLRNRAEKHPDLRRLRKRIARREKRQPRVDRRCKNGLVDARYRTEIPAYTISLCFLAAQILVIWGIV